ncbi:ABC transporter permease [Oscillospiraceae bacterium HV4-5-C5C]|nr:ABC transporter permease [Oscillospiraceae bacterium HV4-5-C5C]
MSKQKGCRPGWFLRLLGYKKTQFLTIPLFSILCSLLAIAILILLIGKNPLTAFQSLLQGSGWLPKPNYAAGKSILTDLLEMLDAYTPMLFASLAVALAFKAGLFNIGVSGQMLLAGFVTTVLVGYQDFPAGLAKPLVVLLGFICGSLVGALIGFLKYRFNVNEVVSSIMLNYIIQYVVGFFIQTRYVDVVSRQSRTINAPARLTLVDVAWGGVKLRLPLLFIPAILMAVLLYFYLKSTVGGYELKAVGLNRQAARYAGIKVGKRLVSSMTLSGGLAGLAGVTYYLGYYASIKPNELASLGFDSIAVSLLGNSHPLGIIFSSLLITSLDKGSTYMNSTVGVRQEVSSLVTGMILLFSACSAYIRYKVDDSLRLSLAGSEGTAAPIQRKTPASGSGKRGKNA